MYNYRNYRDYCILGLRRDHRVCISTNDDLGPVRDGHVFISVLFW